MNAVSRKPSRVRFAGLIFLAVYPLVTALLYATLALTPGDTPLWGRTLVMVPLVVIAMVWAIIPTIQTRLSHLL